MHIADILMEMKAAPVAEPLKVQHAPTGDDLRKCYALGEEIARKLKENKEAA